MPVPQAIILLMVEPASGLFSSTSNNLLVVEKPSCLLLKKHNICVVRQSLGTSYEGLIANSPSLSTSAALVTTSKNANTAGTNRASLKTATAITLSKATGKLQTFTSAGIGSAAKRGRIAAPKPCITMLTIVESSLSS